SQSLSLFQPYPNKNAFLLGEWYWNGGTQKTQDSFRKLMDIICSPSFNPADVRDISWDSLNNNLGASSGSEGIWLDEPDAGWTETTITLPIPFHRSTPNPGLGQYTFPPFRHRSIVDVLKEKMANPHDFKHFHLEPYELRWRRRDMSPTESTRVHGELYTSPVFLEAHEEIQAAIGVPGCTLPRVLIGLMFGSDSTHLTSFGTAALWPCYMYFGNESKYRRCKPSCRLCNHIAYFQKVPPELKDFVAAHSNEKGPSEALMAHLQREYIHAQWKELLDDDFLEAYEHGIVIECCDGKKRRFYLRIFAYSADYPEKVILSGIRNMGCCPCPRCLVPKNDTDQLGTKHDQHRRVTLARKDDLQYRVKVSSAHDIIYQQNRTVDSNFVEHLLKSESLVPTQNAFSEQLSSLGFDLFTVFLVDFMHEFELGVWKRVFIHLLRILQSIDGATSKLDSRFRAIPTFGRDTIRRFTNNVSELKKLGARDYENLLQCSMPVFEGLLPEPHNSNLLDILFTLAHWHAMAKLRQHTELSLHVLESITAQLGRLLRNFRDTTSEAFETKELKREVAARMRRSSKKPTSSTDTSPTQTALNPEKRNKGLNLNTYKNHSLGDYVEMIRRNGTIDSYSTEAMELEHRSPKSRYLRTSRKDFESQLSRIERRQARIRPELPGLDYHIGKTQNHALDIGSLARESGSLATKDFAKRLKEHLLPRILARLDVNVSNFEQGGPSLAETARDAVIIKDNRVFNHKLARFYYTTYDVRRSEDVINPRTSHCDVMLLADFNSENVDSSDSATPTDHPFLYARVIAIYHVNVVYVGPGMTGYEPSRFDFLHVRWFQIDKARGVSSAWEPFRLDLLSFPPTTAADAFSFVDPSLILRSCHLIPAFSLGKKDSAKAGHIIEPWNDCGWNGYYVNRFVDRDMVMRYHWGLGVGHTYSHGRDVLLQKDSTTSSTSEADGPDEEDPSGSSAPIQADNVSGDAGGSEKENELEINKRLHRGVSEPEDVDDAAGATNGHIQEVQSASDSNANARVVSDEADASGDSDSESGSSNSSDDREDFDNDEDLELYHTYNSK
ncbi:hypothetical protein HYPSUDRAFT_133110, partial [Hypholoma sublateritium FD-334 SS-4]